MNSGHQHRVFGRRAQEHILILASGDKVRHMTVRPWMAALAFCFVGVFSIGYLLATSYLVLRDDLIGATMARQARMQHDYEDRIAALRAQVDRITSRQLLDQQVVEDKVDKLMEQQMALTSRHGKLDNLLDRAESSGLTEKDGALPAPTSPFSPMRPISRTSVHRLTVAASRRSRNNWRAACPPMRRRTIRRSPMCRPLTRSATVPTASSPR